MNILKEAFSENMPQFIKDFMKTKIYNRYKREYSNYAQSVAGRGVDPANAQFVDVKNESVASIRKQMKENGAILFARTYSDKSYNHNMSTIMAIYDSNNNVNKLFIYGFDYGDFKETSLKKIIENASQLYLTKYDSSIAQKRSDRRDSRKGIISRDGDSAQNTERRWTFNIEDWKKDASGYWYDANRLVKKLAELHENDFTYYINKGAEIFKDMVDVFADTMKSKAANLDKDSFRDSRNDISLSRFIYEGQRILEDAAREVSSINDNGSVAVKSLEELNSDRAKKGKEPIDKETYEDGIEYAKSQVKRHFAQLKNYQRNMNELLSK